MMKKTARNQVSGYKMTMTSQYFTEFSSGTKPDCNKIKTTVLPRLGARKIKTLNNEKERLEVVFKELVGKKNKSERDISAQPQR